jgi:hypothetical protein
MDEHGRIHYYKYITKPEMIQHRLGIEIVKLSRYDYFEKINYGRLNDSIELWKKYGHLINDENQTDITRNILCDLLESCYIQKFTILRYKHKNELLEMLNRKKTMKMINAKQVIKNKLNKIIPKLKSNMIRIEKKQFLINVEPIQLPHDIENLIFTFLF